MNVLPGRLQADSKCPLVTGAEGLAGASAGVHIVLPSEPTAWL